MKNKTRKELIKKLNLALDELEACPQNSSEHYFCVEDFQDKLGYSAKRIEENDDSVLKSLIAWFTPTFDWDTFVDDADLGFSIFNLLIELRRETQQNTQLGHQETTVSKSTVRWIDVNLKSNNQTGIFNEIQEIICQGRISDALYLGKKHNISEEELTKPWKKLIDKTVVFVDIKTKINNLRDLFAATEITYFNQGMKSISPLIGCLTNLKSLGLSNNNLTKIPKEIGHLTNLKTLNLGGNKLKSLPKEIGNLTNLTFFNFSGNNFTRFPKVVLNFTELENLYLYENQISKLPEDFGKLTELRKLLLKNNQFSTLPKSFKNLINIKQLHLDHNLFEEVPESLAYLKKLQTLFFGNNNFTVIPKFLEDLPRLDTLFVDSGLFTAEQEIRFKLPPMEYNF